MVLWLASLDVFGDDVEAVELGGKARGDGADRLVALLGDLLGGAGRIEGVDGAKLVRLDELAALAERYRQRLHGGDVGKPGALDAEQVHLDAQIVLADDVEAALRQQVVDIGDAAIERVFDRYDAVVGLPVLHGGDGVFEIEAGHRLALGKDCVGRRMAEGAGLALEGQSSWSFRSIRSAPAGHFSGPFSGTNEPPGRASQPRASAAN